MSSDWCTQANKLRGGSALRLARRPAFKVVSQTAMAETVGWSSPCAVVESRDARIMLWLALMRAAC
eukprot:677993-Pyramimonas_sp.AAC.1